MFEIVDDDVWTDAGACVYYQLTHEPLAQASEPKNIFFSWSCDPDVANKLSFPLPKEAPHKIWL